MIINKKIGIYKITSPTGKIYIGLSTDIIYRWSRYKKLYCYGQTKLFNSLKKYGIENHIFEIIHECKEEELNYWEEYYGKLFNVTGENGLNIRDCGGNRGRLSEETKCKLRKINLGKKYSEEVNKKKGSVGEKNHNYGKKLSCEVRNKISNATKGRIAHNKGKPITEKVKLSLLIANLGREKNELQKKTASEIGKRPKSKETRDKMRIAATGRKMSSELIEKREATKRLIREERRMMIF
jgi:group I intron endonuclease